MCKVCGAPLPHRHAEWQKCHDLRIERERANATPDLVIPPPEVRARPATADEIPRAAKKYASREGVTVSYARGYGELGKLVDAPERGEGKRKRETSIELIESIVIRGDRWVAVWENGRTAGAFRWTPDGGWKRCAVAEIG